MSLAYESKKQIKKAVVSDFIGSFSNSFFNFAISLYILKLTGSALHFGTTLLIGPLIGIVFSPLIGYISDHYDHKTVIMISQISCVLLLFGYGLLFPVLGSWHDLMVMIMVATMGLNMRLFNITYQAAVSRLVDRPFIQQLNALEQSSVAMANIAGPIAAGAVFALISFTFFIYFEAAAELIVILIVFSMNFHLINEKPDADAQSETMWTAMKQGLIYVKNRPLIIFMIAGASLLNFLYGVFNVGFPYLIIHVLHMANLQYSVTEALFSLGMVAGGLAAAKLRVNENPILLVSKASFFVSVPIIFILIPLNVRMDTWVATAIFAAVYFIVAVAVVFINVPIQTYMQQTVPAHYQGRVFTILMVGCTSLQPLGTFVYGVLFQYTSASAVISVSFLCLLAISLLAWAFSAKAGMSEPDGKKLND